MKLYVVVADGYISAYGASNFLIGVYDNKQDAKLAQQQVLSINDQIDTDILETELNDTHQLKKSNSIECDYSNDLCIGGYIE